MASFMHSLKDNYRDWQRGQNAEVDKWFLMDGPGEVLGIVIVYLLFVLRIGPAIMKDRPAMKLRNTMVIYNGLQVLFSIGLVYMCSLVELPLRTLFSSACQQQKLRMNEKYVLVSGAWWYFIAKVSELLDTVFFVLRKRERQITFLHVYHHSITVFFSWCFLKYAPGEQGAMIGLLNSIVHVFMYFYYMVAAMGPQYQKYLWWKKYMTIIQLVQFCMMITYLTLLTFSNCGYQRSISYFFIGNAMIFLYLFSDFYRKSYATSRKQSMSHMNGKETNKLMMEENIVSNHFMSDAEKYSQISKDAAAFLNDDIQLRKRE